MERDILQQLVSWRESPFRKPLVLKGARQVGKTWVLKELGKKYYANTVHVSLENIAPGRPSEFAEFFETTNDPHRIAENISLAIGKPIKAEETLLILDEIQDCPAAISSLKYFYENAPDYHVACAGSLLGVDLASESAFPVGMVTFLQMYPLSFSEYLRATNAKHLDSYCKQINTIEPLPQAFALPLQEKLQGYFTIGGMPEVVSRWAQTGEMAQAEKVLADLLDSYERDFAKHGGAHMYAKISLVWSSLPSQLSRENKKFIYGLVKTGARAREYEDAVQWLVRAGLLYRIYRSNAPGFPVSAYDDAGAFKLYSLDIGILRRLARLAPTLFADVDNLYTEFKGAFAENYALQALLPNIDGQPRYWSNAKPQHEVDFLLQLDTNVLPIEVKSGKRIESPSLRYYTRKYASQTPLAVRFSLKNLSLEKGILSVPLYLADEAIRLIEIALGGNN